MPVLVFGPLIAVAMVAMLWFDQRYQAIIEADRRANARRMPRDRSADHLLVIGGALAAFFALKSLGHRELGVIVAIGIAIPGAIIRAAMNLDHARTAGYAPTMLRQLRAVVVPGAVATVVMWALAGVYLLA